MGRKSDAAERLTREGRSAILQTSYQAVSVDSICRRAGVNKGSFYHFFPSKQDLASRILVETWEQVRTHILEPSLELSHTPLQRIERFFHLTKDWQGTLRQELGRVPGCLFCNLGNELGAQENPLLGLVQDFTQRHRTYLRQAFQLSDGRELPEEICWQGATQLYNLYCGAMLQARLLDSTTPLADAVVAARVLGAQVLANSSPPLRIT